MARPVRNPAGLEPAPTHTHPLSARANGCMRTSLARLWRDQARSEEARELLAPVYDRFTEGLATADLKAAKVLLDGLS